MQPSYGVVEGAYLNKDAAAHLAGVGDIWAGVAVRIVSWPIVRSTFHDLDLSGKLAPVRESKNSLPNLGDFNENGGFSGVKIHLQSRWSNKNIPQ